MVAGNCSAEELSAFVTTAFANYSYIVMCSSYPHFLIHCHHLANQSVACYTISRQTNAVVDQLVDKGSVQPLLEQVPYLNSYGYVRMAIALFGLLGNCVTLTTILFSILRKSFINHYLLALLLSDSLFLVASGNSLFDRFAFWTCFANAYLLNVAICMSNLTIVQMSIERCFAVLWPFKHMKYTDLARWKLILATLGAVMLLSVNVIVAVGQEHSPNVLSKCRFLNPLGHSVVRYLYIWPKMVFTFVLTLLTVLAVNLAIFVHLVRARHSIAQRTPTSRSNNRVLFVIPLVYVLLNLPYNMALLFPTLWDNFSVPVGVFINLASLYMFYANFATNFILYALTRFRPDGIFGKGGIYSKLFRQAMVRVWCSTCRGKRRAHIPLQTTTSSQQRTLETTDL